MPWVYCFLCIVLVGVIPCCQDGCGPDLVLKPAIAGVGRIAKRTHFRHFGMRSAHQSESCSKVNVIHFWLY